MLMPINKTATKILAQAGYANFIVMKGCWGFSCQNQRLAVQRATSVRETIGEVLRDVLQDGARPLEIDLAQEDWPVRCANCRETDTLVEGTMTIEDVFSEAASAPEMIPISALTVVVLVCRECGYVHTKRLEESDG
jgi:hypothetical protein